MREIVNGIFYVLCGGIAWSLLPKDFPPWSTAYRWFAGFAMTASGSESNVHGSLPLLRAEAAQDASDGEFYVEQLDFSVFRLTHIRRLDPLYRARG